MSEPANRGGSTRSGPLDELHVEQVIVCLLPAWCEIGEPGRQSSVGPAPLCLAPVSGTRLYGPRFVRLEELGGLRTLFFSCHKPPLHGQAELPNVTVSLPLSMSGSQCTPTGMSTPVGASDPVATLRFV
jgi:hypothetical protein